MFSNHLQVGFDPEKGGNNGCSVFTDTNTYGRSAETVVHNHHFGPSSDLSQ